MTSTRVRAWALFDRIVATAPLRDANPWHADGDSLRFEPDYDTLCLLLGVPALLLANSQSGVPALVLDVWVSYELRRAGFGPDRVWPRAVAPRVLPREVVDFVAALPAKQRDELQERISVRGTMEMPRTFARATPRQRLAFSTGWELPRWRPRPRLHVGSSTCWASSAASRTPTMP